MNIIIYFQISSNRIGHNAANVTSSSRHNSSLTLVTFNLEPLTDSLEVLVLSGNLLDSLPMQFRGRNFTRLRRLDLSHNDLQGKVSSMNDVTQFSTEALGLQSQNH